MTMRGSAPGSHFMRPARRAPHASIYVAGADPRALTIRGNSS
jgi:hypothetical protein